MRHVKWIRRWPCALIGVALVEIASAGDLNVSGRIAANAVSSECVAQLVRPGTIVAERLVSGGFDVHFRTEQEGGSYLVEVVCGGYRVSTSRPVDIGSGTHVLALGTIYADRPLDADGCRQLRGKEADSALLPMRLAFEKERDIPLTKLSFGPPMACVKETYVIVQALDEYSGPGRHWTLSTSAIDGRISVEQGL